MEVKGHWEAYVWDGRQHANCLSLLVTHAKARSSHTYTHTHAQTLTDLIRNKTKAAFIHVVRWYDGRSFSYLTLKSALIQNSLEMNESMTQGEWMHFSNYGIMNKIWKRLKFYQDIVNPDVTLLKFRPCQTHVWPFYEPERVELWWGACIRINNATAQRYNESHLFPKLQTESLTLTIENYPDAFLQLFMLGPQTPARAEGALISSVRTYC